jgi:hypothetical protein
MPTLIEAAQRAAKLNKRLVVFVNGRPPTPQENRNASILVHNGGIIKDRAGDLLGIDWEVFEAQNGPRGLFIHFPDGEDGEKANDPPAEPTANPQDTQNWRFIVDEVHRLDTRGPRGDVRMGDDDVLDIVVRALQRTVGQGEPEPELSSEIGYRVEAYPDRVIIRDTLGLVKVRVSPDGAKTIGKALIESAASSRALARGESPLQQPAPAAEPLPRVMNGNPTVDAPLVHSESWAAFRESGLLWWVNRSLHLFGWSIVFEMEKQWRGRDELPENEAPVVVDMDDGKHMIGPAHLLSVEIPGGGRVPLTMGGAWHSGVVRWMYEGDEVVKGVYPERVPYRGFSREAEEEGFTTLTEYLAGDAEQLLEDITD